MIYKRYELSLSLNGEDIVHIARNSSGIVVFRENSEKALLKAIDDFEKKKEQMELDAVNDSNKNEDVEVQDSDNEVEKEEINYETKDEEKSTETLLPTQKRITRGPDGKFISKSQLDQEMPKKKGFWDKLTS